MRFSCEDHRRAPRGRVAQDDEGTETCQMKHSCRTTFALSPAALRLDSGHNLPASPGHLVREWLRPDIVSVQISCGHVIHYINCIAH